MPEPGPGARSPADAVRLQWWHAAGRPPGPLLADASGQVPAAATRRASVVRTRAPAWEPSREAASRWVAAQRRAR